MSFGVSSGQNSVTVDHVNGGTGLQSLTVVGTPMNATVTTPPFTPGTFNPTTVSFTVINPNLRTEFTLRAASSFHAILIRVRCEVCTPTMTVTDDPVQLSGLPAFKTTAEVNAVMVDHANVGTGLQTFTIVNSTNAGITTPGFTPGMFNPVRATFNQVKTLRR